MPDSLPSHARCVIIGGGVVGCSVAYHLTKLGWSDIVLLEQGRLSGGTTWHAAGLVGQLRSQASMTSLIRYSTRLYAELEAETGLATGWKNCGSLSVARSEDRMTVLKRSAAAARAQGVEAQMISPREAGDLWPVMAIDDLKGAVWLPGDGKANPTDLTQSLAKGARNGGASIHEKVRVTGITTKDGRATGVETAQGNISADIVVNCAGQWARNIGQMCGVSVPLHSAEHMYVVTGKIEGVHTDLPVMRDPDGYIYFKEEVGGLVMGGFEPAAKPWGMDGIPDDFEFSLLPDDWDQFEVLYDNAMIRVPQLADAEIKQFYNGPESFTPDNNFIVGEAPELRNFFVGAGFNSMGIASAGGAGMALAEWIVNGAPTMDLWPVDIRRFARFNNNTAWLHDRVKETLGLHYAMPWPNRELDTARPLRRSPLYDRLAAKGACFGSKMGWERANWFAPAEQPARNVYDFGRQNWHEAVGREVMATRQTAGLFDQSSFAKLLVQGRGATNQLNRICGADVDVSIGRSVYTGILNASGGYESDLTVMRLASDRFLLITGSAQAVRDHNWIAQKIDPDAHAFVTDVTSAYAVIALMGPKAREILSKITPQDLSNEAFPFASVREIDLGYGTGYANRMTYVGELGWELIIPVEFAVGIYEALHEAGTGSGLIDAGYYALESMRLEKAFRAWGRELTPDINPIEAGLSFAVSLDKAEFGGREAVLAAKAAGAPKRRIVQFTLTDSAPMLWGGEAVLRDGVAVGELKSAFYGFSLGRSVGLGLIEHEAGVTKDFIEAGVFEIDLAGVPLAAKAHMRPAYDPSSARVKS